LLAFFTVYHELTDDDYSDETRMHSLFNYSSAPSFDKLSAEALRRAMCPQRQVLEVRLKAANEEFSDLVLQLAGKVSGRDYDSLTTKKDLAWTNMKDAERALESHKKEHGC
jgi:hypothetical protein